MPDDDAQEIKDLRPRGIFEGAGVFLLLLRSVVPIGSFRIDLEAPSTVMDDSGGLLLLLLLFLFWLLFVFGSSLGNVLSDCERLTFSSSPSFFVSVSLSLCGGLFISCMDRRDSSRDGACGVSLVTSVRKAREAKALDVEACRATGDLELCGGVASLSPSTFP